MIKPGLLLLLAALSLSPAMGAEKSPAADKTATKGWPKQVKKITYPSNADNTPQPAIWYASSNQTARPLLVGLHTWSGDYTQSTSAPYAEWCITNDWVFIHPNFRGKNNHPEAVGSELVVKDIVSAVEYARKTANIDPTRIYLVGVSGGGYGSLLMAGRTPEIWAGVSAWVPLTDLKTWYFDSRKRKAGYADDIVKAVGGTPGESAEADNQCRQRSVITYLTAAKGLPVDINAGIHDGHTGSIPIGHSLNAFNLLAAPDQQIAKDDIQFMEEHQTVPPHLKNDVAEDMTYGTKKVLFRRQSGSARVTLFEGGHEIVPEAALSWLAKQRKQP